MGLSTGSNSENAMFPLLAQIFKINATVTPVRKYRPGCFAASVGRIVQAGLVRMGVAWIFEKMMFKVALKPQILLDILFYPKSCCHEKIP